MNSPVRPRAGNHPGMTLQAGSPIARAACQLWRGDAAVVLDSGKDPLAEACDLVRWLVVEGHPGTRVMFMAAPDRRKELGRRVWTLLHDQIGIWETGYGPWRDHRAVGGPPPVILSDWSVSDGLLSSALVVVDAHAPLDIPRRQRIPQLLMAGNPPAAQLTRARSAVAAYSTRSSRADRWGDMPVELALAGAPR